MPSFKCILIEIGVYFLLTSTKVVQKHIFFEEFWTLEQNILSLCPFIAFKIEFTSLQPLQHMPTYSSQLLCEENVNRKRKMRPRIFYFAFGSMLKVLDSYFIKQRDSATDGRISSKANGLAFATTSYL